MWLSSLGHSWVNLLQVFLVYQLKNRPHSQLQNPGSSRWKPPMPPTHFSGNPLTSHGPAWLGEFSHLIALYMRELKSHLYTYFFLSQLIRTYRWSLSNFLKCNDCMISILLITNIINGYQMGNKNDILYINEYVTGLEASVRGERMPPISLLKISAAYYLSVHFVHISQTLMKQVCFFKRQVTIILFTDIYNSILF